MKRTWWKHHLTQKKSIGENAITKKEDINKKRRSIYKDNNEEINKQRIEYRGGSFVNVVDSQGDPTKF